MTVMTAKSAVLQRVHRWSLKEIAKDLMNRYSAAEIMEIIDDVGFSDRFKAKTVTQNNLVNFLLNISTETSVCLFLSFLEHLTDKRMFNGSKDQAEGLAHKYSGILKFDSIEYYKEKWYVGPTNYELSHNWEHWRGADGEIYEYDGDDKDPDYFIVLERDGSYLHEGKLFFDKKDGTKKFIRAFMALHDLIPKGGFCSYSDYKDHLVFFDNKLFKDGNKTKSGFQEWSRKILTEKPRSVNKFHEGLITIRDGEGFEYHNKIPKSKN
jgi:hypothetical protein